MDTASFDVVTYAGHPELRTVMDKVGDEPWPEFMRHDAVSNSLWHRLYDVFPDFQFGLVETRSGRMVAMANSIPLAWHGNPRSLPDDGWDWAMAQGFEDRTQGKRPRTLSALCISITRDYRGKGLSSTVVQAMRRIALKSGMGKLVAPVRPNLKARFPLIPIDKYVTWKREDGAPYDAWIRVHTGLGAAIISPCHRSMRIVGSVRDWADWTGLSFPGSGQYVVPEALVPVVIDRDADTGVYVEPNVWMVHDLAAAQESTGDTACLRGRARQT
jgi:GNAT superfamily N-acetyltransferase